jgi:hypothetical protein
MAHDADGNVSFAVKPIDLPIDVPKRNNVAVAKIVGLRLGRYRQFEIADPHIGAQPWTCPHTGKLSAYANGEGTVNYLYGQCVERGRRAVRDR